MGMAEMGVPHTKIPIRALIGHLEAQIIPRNPMGSANTLQSAKSPTTNYVATSPATNPKWLIDCGTSHNITSDLANLFIHFEYDDTDEGVIGDGSGQDHGGGSTQRCV
ncbi:hypothetical protein AAG906_007269 [Vitis piasezkii]